MNNSMATFEHTFSTASQKLEHGTRLSQAARDFNIPEESWLDLSTSINPQGWPVSSLPPLTDSLWQRLPQEDDGLLDVARRYYGSRNLLPVAGSLAAIRHLPRLMREHIGVMTMICLQPTFAEHQLAWAAAGHIVESVKWSRFQEGIAGFAASAPSEADVHSLSEDAFAASLATGGHPYVFLLGNPNNPTGHTLSADTVLALARQLATKGGWLVVDEALADSRPEFSVAAYAGSYAYPRLIVLRSLSKFFGLAGLRVGFVCATSRLLAALDEWLGPWTLSTSARHIAARALEDSLWQAMTQTRLQDESERLVALLTPLASRDSGGETMLRSTDLFVWLRPAQPAAQIYAALAGKGILVRHFADAGTLRVGLPGEEAAWIRLKAALQPLSQGTTAP